MAHDVPTLSQIRPRHSGHIREYDGWVGIFQRASLHHNDLLTKAGGNGHVRTEDLETRSLDAGRQMQQIQGEIGKLRSQRDAYSRDLSESLDRIRSAYMHDDKALCKKLNARHEEIQRKARSLQKKLDDLFARQQTLSAGQQKVQEQLRQARWSQEIQADLLAAEKQVRECDVKVREYAGLLLQDELDTESSLAAHGAIVDKTRVALAAHGRAIEDLQVHHTRNRAPLLAMKTQAATERIKLAIDRLIVLRAAELVVEAVTSLLGIAAAARTVFAEGAKKIAAWGVKTISSKLAQDASAWGISQACDWAKSPIFYRVMTPENVMACVSDNQWRNQFQALAYERASKEGVGGFTEVGAKLFGDQFQALQEAFLDLAIAQGEEALWNAAEQHEQNVVEEGHRLLTRLLAEHKDWVECHRRIVQENRARRLG